MVARLPKYVFVVGMLWVVLCVTIFIGSIATSGGTDPSACGTCPPHWQQQMALREGAP